MIKPAVELVEHPGGAGIDQQVRGAADQVVVVELRRVVLALGVGVEHGSGERHQRRRGLGHAPGAAIILHPSDTIGFGQEQAGQRGVLGRKPPVDEAARIAGLAVGAEEVVAPLVPAGRAPGGIGGKPVQHRPAPFGAFGRAMLLDMRGSLPQRRLSRPRRRGGDQAGLVLVGAAERTPLRGSEVGQPARAGQTLAVAPELRNQTPECIEGDKPGEAVKRRPGFGGNRMGQHVLARVSQRLGRVAVLDQAEVRRDARLEREAAQQRLAEGVDGADPRAAGQVEHLREQRACPVACLRAGRDMQAAEFGVERVVAHAHPPAEPAMQPVGHFGGGGLSEGEALDARGIGPREHEAKQPVGQQLGLAGARRGGDEGRRGGVGRLRLRPVGALSGALAQPASSACAHSATRASWA